MTQYKTICLCMMVRNEAHVIRRALESVKKIIDYWVICDTGSTDDTMSIIRETLHDVPGELHEVPWVNFGHNRTQITELGFNKADYLLIMDADMTANVYAPFKHLLTADAYEIRYEGDDSYTQRMLVSGKIPWRFIGVTHEYIDSPALKTVDWLEALTLNHYGDGGMRSDKFERDIRLLTEGLISEPDNSRYIFYLAQSYKDLQRYEESLPWFQKRAAMEGTWEEERWFAQKQVGRMKLRCGYDWKDTYHELMEAYRMRPWRLEPLHLIVQQLRIKEEYEQGYMLSAFITKGFEFPSKEILFVDKPVYDYLMLLEHGVCAYGTGRAEEAAAVFNMILDRDDLPADIEASALRGRKLSLEQLYPKLNDTAKEPNRIVVVSVISTNSGLRLQEHIRSLMEQKHPDYEIVFVVNDQLENLDVLPQEDERITVLTYSMQEGYAAGIHEAVSAFCSADDIVVLMNGEDVLTDTTTLSHIDQSYRDYDCWVLYGQYAYANGRSGKAKPLIGNNGPIQWRRQPLFSHSNSFRAGLYHAIADTDPAYACLKSEEGLWYKGAPLTAVMAAVCEMAGLGKIHYTEEIWLQRNSDNEDLPNWLIAAQFRNNLSSIAAQRPLAAVTTYKRAAVTSPKTLTT